MKTFIVKTQSGTNPHLLHSLRITEFSTEDFATAKQIFDAEVEQLKQEYVTADYFDYTPNDYEVSNAVYCSIFALNEDEDGEVNIEYIEDSDYFYEK